jgi:eukaryotic-like serine/threonine-protein kinase
LKWPVAQSQDGTGGSIADSWNADGGGEMNVPPDALLTKTTWPSPAPPGRSNGDTRSSRRGFRRIDAQAGDQIADHLLHGAVRRLQLIAVIAFAVQLVVALAVNLVQGTLADEFTTVLQWGFPVGVIAASLALLLVIRTKRLAPTTTLRLGLIYQVLISFGIAGGSYFDTFNGMAADAISFDLIGITFVAPWMLSFSVLVPTRPREALVALLGSAAAVPLVYLAQVPAGLAPAVPTSTFALVFVFPYVVTAGLAYIAARIIHHLGKEVRHAYEMGSYRLEALLGRGAMGEVWRATHRALARPAAIKLIRPEALGDDPVIASARFEREAQAIASLESPFTVALYDFGSAQDGTLFYVMELLDGVDLQELVRQHGPLPAERVVHILRQACESLAEAHTRAIIHRDIKPANIYLCRRALEHDVVKVLDFGLAKRLAPGAAESMAGSTHTHAELIVGTPAYLAPEVALGGVVDGRADLYSLGCVAFWLLTGRLVFDAPTATAMLVAHAREAPPMPSNLAAFPVPEPLDRLVLSCLAKDPAARPQSAAALAAQLDAVPFARPWSPAAAREWWATKLLEH